ncbi:MAG: hypothetical protein QOF77_2138 [Solirubrobacteraceae bacterium]|nr:hypothetical protein [Solirubrobacteraceae bacterium]
MARARLAALIAGLAVAIRAVVGHGLVNYDTLYALVWGRDIAGGRLPDYGVSIAPTPHPLATGLSVILAPLSSLERHGIHGEPAAAVAVAGAFVGLALLGWVVFRLGAEWFNPWAGAVAAAVILTREPVLDFGARVYVDIPYLVLVLGALLVETRRPRAGAPVLALLAVAGLLRPEAWLLSAAYLAWIWWSDRDLGRLLRLGSIAATGPLLWFASDLLVTGDPLHSLTGTRDTAKVLGRVTGLGNVPATAPRRLGEILREPVLFAAAVGGVLSVLWLRRRGGRVELGAATGLVAFAGFCVLAAAGLPIITRYLLLPACILAIFAGAGAFGWLELEAGDPRRRWWRAAACVVGLGLVVFVPSQVGRIRTLRETLRRQETIQADLGRLITRGTIGARCTPVSVPNHRPVPLLALWLDVEPRAVVSAEVGQPSRGTYVTPANAGVAADYILDKRDPVQVVHAVPAGFAPAGADASWRVFARCP